jgi:AraC-like DNA-binding protein
MSEKDARERQRPRKRRKKLLFCESLTIFLDMSSDTRMRIHRHSQQVPKNVRPLLLYINKYLFSQRLTAQRVYRACNIRDRSFSSVFSAAVGATPYDYIEACRMEVGERLVRETEIKITWISDLLGYASLKVFGNAFGRLTAERPLTYRKRHQAQDLEKGLSPRSAEQERIVKLRRALQGTLEPEEAAVLIGHLQDLYPKTDNKSARTRKTG